MGKGNTFSERKQAVFLSLLRGGESLTTAAESMSIGTQTAPRYAKKFSEFARLLKEALDAGELARHPPTAQELAEQKQAEQAARAARRQELEAAKQPDFHGPKPYALRTAFERAQIDAMEQAKVIPVAPEPAPEPTMPTIDYEALAYLNWQEMQDRDNPRHTHNPYAVLDQMAGIRRRE